MRPFFLLLFLSLFFLHCEKDDVCNEGTPGTPRLVIRFYDKENPAEIKRLPGITIQEINQENPIFYSEFDSIALPLDLTQSYTRYAFVLSSETDTITLADTLQFNIQNRRDIYTRRACGYRAEYELAQPPVTPINTPSWFYDATILIDTIQNEERAHLAIYH